MASPHEGGPDVADGPPDDGAPGDEFDARETLDGLRRAVYAPGASAADLAAYRQAIEARRIAPSRRQHDRDSGTAVAPVPPGRRAATRRGPVALLAGTGILVAVVVAGIAAGLLQAATPSPVPPVAPPADRSAAPTSSRDPTDRSARFREGSGGAAGTLLVPAVAAPVLVVRSDSDRVSPNGTVDGFGGELEFAVSCNGPGTVSLRLLGGATPPLVCRAGRATPSSVRVASAQSVRYSVAVQGSARWALAVGRTQRSRSSPAAGTGAVG